MARGDDNFVKQLWRQIVFDLPRARSHAASRRRVVWVLISFFVVAGLVAAYVVPMVYVELRFGGGWYGVLFCVVLYVFALTLQRWMKKRGNPLTLRLSSVPSPSLRKGLLAQRGILAVLVNRAAFEANRLTDASAIPAGAARAAQIQWLRQREMWDGLDVELRDLLSSPEGSWEKERIGRVLIRVEAVRVLSWALDAGSELPPLQTAAIADDGILGPVLADVLKEEELFLRTREEIDAELAPADAYLVRLQNELVKRQAIDGKFDSTMDERVAGYMAYASSVGEMEVVAEDLPVGDHLVPEADTDSLLNLRGIAAVRYVMLEALKESLESGSVDSVAEQVRLVARG